MKIRISSLETVLGKKIKRNTSVLGMDTAYKRTGWCIITTNKTYLNIDDYGYIDIVGDNDYTKYNTIINIFKELVKDVKSVIIEDTFLKIMRIKGRTIVGNPDGFKKITRVGGIAYTLARLAGKYVEYILASSARKKIGIKNGKKEKVQEQFKHLLSIDIEDDDIIDAIILALGGCILLEE